MATLSYYTPGSLNSIGIYEEGALVSIGIVCNAQPNSTKYILGKSGDMIGYDWFISSPIFAGVDGVPDDAKLTFFSKEHIIIQLFKYQKHIEMKC